MQLTQEVFDHFIAADHAGLLLEGDGLFLVFNEISIGRFLFFPTPALHRGGGGGVFHAFDGGHVIRSDLENALVEFHSLVGLCELLLMLGEFVQDFGVLG